MNTQKILITITAAAALTFIVGCDSKKDDPAQGVTNAVNAVATEAGKAVDAAAPAAANIATEVKAAATSGASEAASKVNGIIDQAKAFIGQNKYSEALTTLQGLTDTVLNADQEKIVTGLKEQIQKALAAKTGADAAGAVGNLLKK